MREAAEKQISLDRHAPQDAEFREWLDEVSRILQLMGHPKEDLDHAAWRDLFEDKDTPAMAVQHDLISAL